MFTKTLLATTAAALVSMGALGATTTTASAFPQHQNGGPDWKGDGPGNWNGRDGGWNSGNASGYSFGFGDNGWFFKFGQMHPRPKPVVFEKVCSPTYKTVQVWRPYQGWVWQTVYNGQVCNYVPVHKNW